jgi:roadblock/LC7 domain-containing protein
MVEAVWRAVWRAVRPENGFQRLLWWAGTLLLASAAVHLVVAVVDGGSWWGPVSWRKPVVFGFSMGVLLWSMVWALRRQAARWWVTVPAGLVGASLVLEVALITMQRWRGVPSHFNAATGFDSAIWSVIGVTIMVLTLGVVWSLVASLVRFRGSAATRIAVVAGFAAVLVAGAIGRDMAAIGEAAVDATGRVPDDILFGAAGSAKLAHAVGLHAIQVLAVLAILLDIGRDRGRLRARAAAWAMGVATLGYAAAFGAVTATAYAGRAPHEPTPAMGLALAGGVLAVAVVGVVAVYLARPRVASDDADRDLERELGEAAVAPVPAVARRAEA